MCSREMVKWRGGIGVEDLFEQGPVFERDGLGIWVRGTACLPEQVVSDRLYGCGGEEGGSDKDCNLFYPGIAEMGCFLRDGGGEKAERGVVGFQIELQQKGGRGSGMAGSAVTRSSRRDKSDDEAR